MGSNALFSDQEIQQAGGTPTAAAQSSPALGDSLFSNDEVKAATAPNQDAGFLSGLYNTTVAPVAGMIRNDADYLNSKLAEAGEHLKSGNFLGAAGTLMSMPFDKESPTWKMMQSLIDAHKNQVQQAATALSKGRYSEAAGHELAASIPAIGPAAAQAGTDIGEGRTGQGLGEAAGLVGTVLAPEMVRGTSKAASAVRGVVSEDAAATKAQPIVQNAVRGAAENTAAAEDVTPKAATSVRDSVQNVGDSILARSKDAYNTLDEASGGRWQRFDDQLKNLRDKMDEVAGIDDDQYAKFDQKAKDIEAAQDDLVKSLVNDGKIDPDLAEGAKGDYKRANALYDVSQQIRSSASGLRPEIGGGTPEVVDPGRLAPRLNKLYDSGRLQQALGEDGAQSLMKEVDDALQTKVSGIKTAKLVKTIAKYGASAIGLGLVGHGALAALGGGSH